MTIVTEDQMRERLREACKAAGGQAAFGREIGVSRQYIGQIFAGLCPASKAVCNKIRLTGETRLVYVVSDPP